MSNPEFKINTGESGSIAEKLQKKSFGQAKGLLIFAGITLLISAGITLATAESQSVDAARAQAANKAEVEQLANHIMLGVYIIGGGIGVCGLALFILGFFVKRAPVGVTAAGLMLYLGVHGALGFLDPTNIVSGIIVKILIVVGLIASLKSAVAYEAAQKKKRFDEDGLEIVTAQ